MSTFSFEPTESLSSDILRAKSTFAKVAFQPKGVYISAKLESPEDGTTAWKAIVDYTPKQRTHLDKTATLYITKGELGKILGTVELGQVHDGE